MSPDNYVLYSTAGSQNRGPMKLLLPRYRQKAFPHLFAVAEPQVSALVCGGGAWILRARKRARNFILSLNTIN